MFSRLSCQARQMHCASAPGQRNSALVEKRVQSCHLAQAHVMLILLAPTQTDKAFCLYPLGRTEQLTALQAAPQQSKEVISSPMSSVCGCMLRSHAVEQVQRQPVSGIH